MTDRDFSNWIGVCFLVLINAAFLTLLATPIATVLSRNSAFVLLAISTLLLAASYLAQPGSAGSMRFPSSHWLQKSLNRPITVVTIASVIYAMSSLVWSPLPERGLGALAQTTAATLMVVLGCYIVARPNVAPVWLPRALLLSLAIGLAFVVFELSFGSPIRGLLGASTEPYRLNRAALCMALFVPLLFLRATEHLLVSLRIVLIVCIGGAVLISQSESAKLAFLVVLLTYAFTFWTSSRIAIVLLGSTIIVLHVFAPLLAIAINMALPREMGETLSQGLFGDPYYFVRIEIWWAHVQQILSAPILGHGLQASQAAPQIYAGSDPAVIRGLSYGHPHSLSIQVWYELGSVGVLLSSALIWFVMQKLASLRRHDQKVAVAVIAGVWSVAYVGHGAWQHWWWALVGTLTVLFVSLKQRNPSDGNT